MSGYKLFSILCLSLLIASIECKPGIIRNVLDGVFGNDDKHFHKGYEQGLRDSETINRPYPQPQYAYNPQSPYYPPQQPIGPYEHKQVSYNQGIHRQYDPYPQGQPKIY